MTATAREVVLGRGLIDQTGARHRRARVRPLDGHGEAALAAADATLGAAGLTRLLAGRVERLGGFTAVAPDHVAALSRGDRWRLALTLWALMFGEVLRLTARCPNPDCGALADLDLRIDSLLGPAGPPEPEWITAETDDGRAWLRPPAGVDDEACERAGGDDASRAALLWSRLVARLGDRDGITPEDWRSVRPATRDALALALAAGDSSPDLALVATCPECRAWLELELDPGALLVRGVLVGADRLLAEVHSLAFHYGWAETEILALPRPRRRRYLELLRAQLEGRPLVDPWS